MNITESQGNYKTKTVGQVQTGTVVKFLEKFHQDHCVATPYMVCHAPDGYRPDHDQYGKKIPVAHMRTGKISYVCCRREVQLFKADCNITPAR